MKLTKEKKGNTVLKMNENIIVYDNFIEKGKAKRLQGVMVGLYPLQQGTNRFTDGFQWYQSDGIVSEDDVDKFQFIHPFYVDPVSTSTAFAMITPILKLLKPLMILKIRAKLLTRTPEIEKSNFHTDIMADIKGPTEEKISQITTAIYYVNANNGYTEFEDGTKVESVENRLVIFPSNIKHRGTSCTNEQTRMVINFNYFAVTQHNEERERITKDRKLFGIT